METPRAFAPLLKPARYKGAHGGRGSGKSHFFAEMLIECSAIEKTDAVCVREVQRSLKQSVKKLLEHKIEALGVQSYFRVLDTHIESKHGGVIIFEGMQNHTNDSIKSLEGFDIAWVEEAQSLSARSLELLTPTIRKNGSEIWFSWNPLNKTDPVDMFLRGDQPPPDSVVVEVNYHDNPWFPSVLQAEMEYMRVRDPDKYQHIWRGQYESASEARVFKNWRIEAFERPAGTIYRFGADWGYSVDPSVLVRLSVEGNRIYIDHEAYVVGCEIVNLPDLFDTVPESRRWFITADSSRPETISHLQKHGFPKIAPSQKGAGSVKQGVEFMQSFDIIVHPRCLHVIDELGAYQYKRDPMTNEIISVLPDKKNHTIDAIRYAIEGVMRAAKAKQPRAPQFNRINVGDSRAGY
nr:PBSX family phage terminase large subunit [Aquidulcibacter sp.]